MVYDLGGGTFDVTLLETTKKQTPDGRYYLDIKTLCKDGSRQLGGTDWDKVLIDHIADKCLEAKGYDPRTDERSLANIRERAVDCKCMLSQMKKYSVVLDIKGELFQMDITREEFEQMTKHLLDQTEVKINDVIEKAQKEYGLDWDQIDNILLAGGATRMPYVHSMIKRVTGKDPRICKNVDQIVSIGAAYDAQIATMEKQGKPLTLSDKKGNEIAFWNKNIVDVGKAIGITIMQMLEGGERAKRNMIVIPDSTPAGEMKEVRDIATLEENQTEVEFVINEGDAEHLKHCQELGKVMLSGLPPNRPAHQPLSVQLKYDQNGIIVGKGMDINTGKEIEIYIERNKISTNKAASDLTTI